MAEPNTIIELYAFEIKSVYFLYKKYTPRSMIRPATSWIIVKGSPSVRKASTAPNKADVEYTTPVRIAPISRKANVKKSIERAMLNAPTVST